MPTQTSDWLDEATSKGSTKWLQQFISVQLPLLIEGVITSAEFADELESEFASRMLNTLKQQKNYRSNVVQAIKVVNSEHPAIALVAPTTEQYKQLNDEQKERVTDRETRFILPDALEMAVDKATRLLQSEEWSDVGAGLAVLIGRRISEILLSEFSLNTAWSLNFSQMSKKFAEESDIIIEIPTLAPAAPVLAAITKLQSCLAIADLKQNSPTPRQPKQAVNQLYSSAIAQKCAAYFSGLVPSRTDKDNLYTHIFRAVYATIAAHWYCPPSVPVHNYKAEIQGHFTMTAEGKKLHEFAARSNYDDYAISDGQGNRDGRLGIKLGHIEDLQVIMAFRKPEETAVMAQMADDDAEEEIVNEPEITEEREEEETTMTPEADTQKQATKRPQLYADDIDRLTTLMAQEGVTGATAELLHALLNAYEQQQQGQVETVGEVAQTFNWFTDEIDTLRAQILDLKTERDRLAARQPENTGLNELKTENAQLREQLRETTTQLNGIQALLGGGPSDVAPAQPTAAVQPVASPPTAKATTKTVAKSAAPTNDQIGSQTKIEGIIEDIIKWNTAQEDPDERLRISVAVVKALGGLVGASYQSAYYGCARGTTRCHRSHSWAVYDRQSTQCPC